MAEHDDLVYIQHILDAIERIEAYTMGMGWDEFRRDEKTQDAVIRNLEIIGEAAKKVSDSFKKRHNDIEWSQMARMRDILIHRYFGVNVETVWLTVEQDLPPLKEKLLAIVEG